MVLTTWLYGMDFVISFVILFLCYFWIDTSVNVKLTELVNFNNCCAV